MRDLSISPQSKERIKNRKSKSQHGYIPINRNKTKVYNWYRLSTKWKKKAHSKVIDPEGPNNIWDSGRVVPLSGQLRAALPGSDRKSHLFLGHRSALHFPGPSDRPEKKQKEESTALSFLCILSFFTFASSFSISQPPKEFSSSQNSCVWECSLLEFYTTF